MAESSRRAAEDAGPMDLLSGINMLCVPNIISWGYVDPPARLAERIRANPAIRWYTGVGACAPQWFMGEIADRIASGQIQSALICGAESYASEYACRRQGKPLPWRPEEGTPRIVGDQRPPMTPLEQRHSLFVPAHLYALFENALRHHRGLSLEEHRHELGQFCAGLSRIAADNPYAWFRKERTPGEIITITRENRMIAFPFAKLMCSMMFVDQSAAVLVMSLAEARRRNIPEDKYIFPVGIGEAWDLWHVIHRENFYTSPSVKAAVNMAIHQAGVSLDEVDFLDFYSCFPCVPRIVRDTLGISPDDPRPLTVTGGMPYFGGPGNNYSLHATCRMVETLRTSPGKTGLVQALSWFLHKHAVGIYRGRPNPEGWKRTDPGPFLKELEKLQQPAVVESPEGETTVETYTVVYEGEDPVSGFVIGRTPKQERFLARVEDDQDTLKTMTTREVIGLKGVVTPSPSLGINLFRL